MCRKSSLFFLFFHILLSWFDLTTQLYLRTCTVYFDKKGVVSHCIHISIWSGSSSEKLFKFCCLYNKIACSVVVFLLLILATICFVSVVERHTRLLCSTLERAKRTSAPSCLTVRAVRPMKTLCLDWDGRCRQPHPLYPQIQHKFAHPDEQAHSDFSKLHMYPSGGPGHTLWLYGWPPEEWQHRSNGSLLCYLHHGSHLPCLYSYAIWFWWLPDQKGKKNFCLCLRLFLIYCVMMHFDHSSLSVTFVLS